MHLGVLIALAIVTPVALVLSIPIIAIVTYHKRKVLEIRLRGTQQADERVLAEMRSLREQMVELRDTTTKYDVTIDTAIKRLESRVANLEQRTPYETDSGTTTVGNRVG